MKTSFHKFMASNAVTEVSNVELGAVKVDLAMDINAIMKAKDALLFENAKLEGKAISLLNDAFKVYTSSWPDAKPLLAEFENALNQMKVLGFPPPAAFANSYATLKKEIGNIAKMKTEVLGKLHDIDDIFGKFDI